MITLNKILFDPTLPADGASLGAYLRASDGTLLTHTDVSGKKALDVNIASGVNVEVDLSHVDDSIRLGDGTALFTSTSENSDIALDVHISNTELSVIQGSDSPWSIDDNGGSLTVDASQLDIDDLDYTSDNVAIKGSTGNQLVVAADGSIGVTFASATAAAYGAKSITSTATKVITTNLANRRKVIVQNLGSKDMFFGHDVSVTAATGILISAGSSVELELGATLDVYAITASSTADARYFEVA